MIFKNKIILSNEQLFMVNNYPDIKNKIIVKIKKLIIYLEKPIYWIALAILKQIDLYIFYLINIMK